MKKSTKLGLLAFVIAECVCVFTAWLCGVNFDHRGPDAGGAFIMATLFSILIASFFWSQCVEDEIN